jgi:DNA invertase Pin-like site-specific DNA recombinase
MNLNNNGHFNDNSLDYFNNLIPKKEEISFAGKEVVLYDRVSSKNQFENGTSIENQRKNILSEIDRLGAICIKRFGGTYESAKTDEDRKGFAELLSFIKKAKKKPFAIFVNDMSRFSRSGGSSIGIMGSLKEMGIYVYEVTTGVSNISDRGELNIYKSSLTAREENIRRTELTRPNIIRALERGIWFGRAPLGYELFGRRVKDPSRVNGTQTIKINDTGKLLKKAFEWKLTGKYSDVEIISKLRAMGLKISAQKISKTWRNPFYCGIIISKYLPKAVKGNWDGIITKEQFIKIQNIVNDNPCGFKHVTNELSKVLGSGFSKCSVCGTSITAYTNKKKKIPYYKCRVCKSNANAYTTDNSKFTGLNDIFLKHLKKYSIQNEIYELVKIQTIKLFSQYNQENELIRTQLTSRLKKIQEEIRQLRIAWGRETKPAEVCRVTISHLEEDSKNILQELDSLPSSKSNLEFILNTILEKLRNIDQFWLSLKYEGRTVLQRTIFPNGIRVDLKNRLNLTGDVNRFIEVINTFSTSCDKKESGNQPLLIANSHYVARSGVEPESAAADMNPL